MLPFVAHAQAGKVLVRHAPTINGHVEGSVHVMSAENVTVGQDAVVTGNLLLPGTPTINQHATSGIGVVLEGPGAPMPSAHSVMLNAGSSLGGLVRRIDAVEMPVVPAVPTPTGTRNVTLTASGQSLGDFGTLKNLTLNGGVGMVAIPPGDYGEFFAFSGSGFVIGVEGSATPAIYNFKSLGMLSGAALQVVGPVIVTADLARVLGAAGHAEHPDWMHLRVRGGSIYASGGQDVYGHVTMPSGVLNIGTGTLFEGGVITDSLVVGSGAVMRVTDPHPTPPLLAGFETDEDYVLGTLHGQSGWLAGSEIAVTDADAASGQNSVMLPGSTPPVSLLRLFDQNHGQNILFADMFVLPQAANDVSSAIQLSLYDAAKLGFVRKGEHGSFMYLAGDGVGGGVWQQGTVNLPLDAHGFTTDWIRVSLRLDYVAKEWDFYVNGSMAGAGISFSQASQASLTAFTLTGQGAAPTLLDDVLVAFDNPLFTDVDRDGMDDEWETSKGLNPILNDRENDTDVDGLSNLQEFAHGTHPTEADTDHDGLTDGEEFQSGTDPQQLDSDGDGITDAVEVLLGYDPTQPQAGVSMDTDADGDGLILEEELLLGTDPGVPDDFGDRDSDGDGLPDNWEITHGMNHLVADFGGVVNEDQDADGLPLIHEARVGTNHINADTDGDSMRDDYEVHNSLNPLADDGETDPDGDGLNNWEEHRRGTDPQDYYNGREHEILPLIGGDFDLGVGGLMAVRVVDAVGNALVNAPVTLTMDSGDSQIALTPDGPLVGQTVEVRTGEDGIARVYLRTP